MKIRVDDIEIELTNINSVEQLDLSTKDYTLHIENIEKSIEENSLKNKED